MLNRLLFTAAFAMMATHASAEMIAIKTVRIEGNIAVVFQFSDRTAPARMCSGANGYPAVLISTFSANLDPRTGRGFGEGCWFIDENDEVIVRGKAFQDGTPLRFNFGKSGIETTPAFKSWDQFDLVPLP